MKKLFTLCLITALCAVAAPVYAQDQVILFQEQSPQQDLFYTQQEDVPVDIVYSDYVVDLQNLYKYNIIALQNADINNHIRGSIWVGGNLTGSQYVDDGSLNGEIASESYVANNISNIYFKSRTMQQSLTSYKGLTDQAVNNAIDYWTQIINSFPNDGVNYIYLPPDENGFVDLKRWDYQAEGSDETMQQIQKVYWTNATSIEMGGLAGHLIAPYADIHIVSCNHRGSIVGWNIYTDGESHINYWTPELKGEVEPTETPIPILTDTPTPIPQFTEKPKPTQPPTQVTPPKTSDDTNPAFWVVTALIAVGIALYTSKKF